MINIEIELRRDEVGLMDVFVCVCVCFTPRQVVCGQNCTFLVQANGTVLAIGEGSYGRLGQGNSDDLYTPTIISALQGSAPPSRGQLLVPTHRHTL